jgi:hypothetical protein
MLYVLIFPPLQYRYFNQTHLHVKGLYPNHEHEIHGDNVEHTADNGLKSSETYHELLDVIACR